ncbi:MAG: DUF3108 domain-containing protein, partial [Panacagrimonas sp.]
MKRFLFLIFALCLSPILSAKPLVPFDSSFVLTRGPLTLGHAQFQLQAIAGEGECYLYQYRAKPQGLARLFIGQIQERSEFCVVEDQIRSQRFSFSRADKEKDNFKLEFDWQNGLVRSSTGEQRKLDETMMDRLVMQLAVKRWAMSQEGEPGPAEYTATKVEDDRAKTYRFRIVAQERIEVPAGTFDTVRVERVDKS